MLWLPLATISQLQHAVHELLRCSILAIGYAECLGSVGQEAGLRIPGDRIRCRVQQQSWWQAASCPSHLLSENEPGGDGSVPLLLMQDKLVPTLVASYKLWPVAHLVNFALVPPAYRVLYTNLVSVRINALLESFSA